MTTSDYRPIGIPFIRGVNLARGIFLEDEFVFVDNDKADDVQSANAVPGDLVFTRKGTIGQVSMIPRNPRFPRYVISGSQMKARLDPALAVPEYYYYWFRSPEGQHALLSHMVTVGVPSLANSLDTLRNIVVPHPPLGEQQVIAALLGALDDKIAVNDRIANTARALGISLFQSALEFADKEMEIGGIASLLTRGQTPKYTDAGNAVTVVNQKCVRDGRVNVGPARLAEASRVKADRVLRKYDVLVNSTGVGTLGRVGIWSDERFATVDSHVTIIRIAPPLPAIIGGFALLAAEPEIEALGEGSTGQTELSRSKLSSLTVRIPADGIEGLARQITGLELRADAALIESKTLAALRDTLLPELMSGRLRVKDAEKVVEDAV
ncbi:restriction endonuclease subunit S [Actinoplanes sp. CA-015351]|uniref:restriction endonuclease subunit S n=1 Tax=Actinoplanes sp. CA-015351 TaxID=3239897 RepID=UPI003D98E8B1